MRGSQLLVASAVTLGGIGCSPSPRITAASTTACDSSLIAVGHEGSRGADSAKFVYVMASLAGSLALHSIGTSLASIFDNEGPTVARPDADSTTVSLALCDALDGMTAREVLAKSDSLGPLVEAAFDRRRAQAYIKALQEAKARHKIIRDSLQQFRVLAARFSQEDGFIGPEATIGLTVENGTAHAVSRAFFRAVAQSEGRQVPWLAEDFNHTIPGGLEPGEKATWRLKPNMMQGDWTSVRVPIDARFQVEVVRLNGADGQPLWGGMRFSEGDQAALDSLLTKYGGPSD